MAVSTCPLHNNPSNSFSNPRRPPLGPPFPTHRLINAFPPGPPAQDHRLEVDPQALEPRANPGGTVPQNQQATVTAQDPQLQQQCCNLQPQTLARGVRGR